ncbi:Hypothetical protein BQ3484_183 [Cedratvirus A11]|uniref:Uncharacterized protein n=1 Tax=Cedratvirus A11 TaxID=1903266 RepID=A0A1M7XU92_9VIRU|nr:Hypothetical protein BQ3484_183 [Cedratvirus A11]SHO33251.1 Hypothetical protein BQ3484_183 [Cedratvirus A11]
MQVLEAIASMNPPYKMLVKGGAASYWYIALLTGIKIPLKDIDLVLNGSSLSNIEIAQDFTHRINQLLPDYKFVLLYNEYNIPVKLSSEEIDIDLFVNDEPIITSIKLQGLPLPKISTLIQRERQDIENYRFEENYMREEGDMEMADMFKQKLDRKVYRLAILLKIGEELRTKDPDLYRKLF